MLMKGVVRSKPTLCNTECNMISVTANFIFIGGGRGWKCVNNKIKEQAC
jgi:hypothetical protein